MTEQEQQEEQDRLASDGDEQENESAVENPVENTIIDGRITGVPPNYEPAEADNPSAAEAEIQSGEKDGGA